LPQAIVFVTKGNADLANFALQLMEFGNGLRPNWTRVEAVPNLFIY